MIDIDGKIVSLDLFNEYFACDLSSCKGCCCVEGNAGAPLEEEEIDILEEEFEAYKPFMTRSGIDTVERQGFMVIDPDGDYTTPLVNDAECAYSFERDGITLCAIEKAWQEGKTRFRKPVSCHLYPIRVARFRNGTYGLNYHRWDICAGARRLGEMRKIPVYQALREPITSRFGKDFYALLEEAAGMLKKEENI